MRPDAAWKLYDCVLVPCEKCSDALSEFGDISRPQSWYVCSPYLHIFEWLPQSFARPWVRSFGISPLSPLLACYCGSYFFLGVTSPLQKYPLLSRASLWHPSFSQGRGTQQREKTEGGEEERVSTQADLDLTSGSIAATTTNTTCSFPLVSFIHSLFTTVVSNEDFEKNSELCTCFRDEAHRKNSETRFCSVFEEPGKGASETDHKQKVVGKKQAA